MHTRKTSGLVIVLSICGIGLNGCGSPTTRAVQTPSVGRSASSIAVSPLSAPVGSGDVSLTIAGTNFDGQGVVQSKVIWSADGTDLALSRTVISTTEIIATVPAAMLTKAVDAKIWVEVFDQIEQTTNSRSSSVNFTVFVPATGSPAIESISPASIQAGSSDIEVRLTGSYFGCSRSQCHCSVVWMTGAAEIVLNSTLIGDSQLAVVIPAALITKPVNAEIEIQFWHKADDVPYAISN